MRLNGDQVVFWIGALLLYQAYATILVALSKALDNEQKLRNIVIIWALPFFGAIYARFALNAAERNARTAETSPPAGKGDAPGTNPAQPND